jgi:hypothetical protein
MSSSSSSSTISFSGSDTKVRVNAINPPKELNITGPGVTVTDNPTLGRYDISIPGGVSTNPLAKGTSTKSGDSTTKIFTFTHSMTNPPVFAVVVPESTDSLGSYTTTWDSTKITITYPFAPPTGTNNLSYAWFAMDINGGGGQPSSAGEANTASNAGVDGIGLVLPKVGQNLPFKAINVGSTKLSVTDDIADNTVDLDVVEANLNIGNQGGSIGNSRITDLAYSKLTSIPTTIVQTNQGNTFGNFAQSFFTQTLDIFNAARSAVYIFSASAITGNRTVTLPLLLSNDQFTFDNFATTLTNKTMDAGSNTFTNLNNAAISATAAISYSKIGTNLLFSESGLTAVRTITFPDASGLVVYSSDSRMTNARTPTTHATTHESGGSDSIPLDTLAATTDITTLNASSTAHGLLPKLSNVSTQYLNGIGTWTTPPTPLIESKGTSTQSGNGTTKIFNIAHGLAGTPTWFSAQATSNDASGSFILSVDSTNLTITYPFAPPNGTNNVSWVWRCSL